MNPFILLVKPLVAVGVLLTKMAVAVGYVATEGGNPADAHRDYASEVRIVVTPSESGIDAMEIELANGELFELASVSYEQRRSPSAPARPGRRPQQRSAARPELIASLESTLGRSMRCDVELGEEPGRGAADCTIESGESYQLVF